MAQVRVGIVSWNTAGLLDRCLASLPAALEGVDASVVVVDNASSDSSADVVKSHPIAQLIANRENVGYARAINQAIGGTEAEVLIALNPDTLAPPHSLSLLTERLLAQSDVGLASPKLVNEDGSLQHSAFTFPSPLQAAAVSFLPLRWQRGRVGRRFWLEGAAPHDQAADVEWTIGAVHAIRAEAVDRWKPYNERWFMYVEDLDLCWRLVHAGWRIRLEADIAITHAGGASSAQAWGQDQYHRFMPSSYDWYAETHGDMSMRWWAAVNSAGYAVQIGAYGLAGLAGRRPARARAAALARQLPLHLRSIIRRPAVPSDAPRRDALPPSGPAEAPVPRSATLPGPCTDQAGRRRARDES